MHLLACVVLRCTNWWNPRTSCKVCVPLIPFGISRNILEHLAAWHVVCWMVLMPHIMSWRAQAALAADDDRYNEAASVQISSVHSDEFFSGICPGRWRQTVAFGEVLRIPEVLNVEICRLPLWVTRAVTVIDPGNLSPDDSKPKSLQWVCKISAKMRSSIPRPWDSKCFPNVRKFMLFLGMRSTSF